MSRTIIGERSSGPVTAMEFARSNFHVAHPLSRLLNLMAVAKDFPLPTSEVPIAEALGYFVGEATMRLREKKLSDKDFLHLLTSCGDELLTYVRPEGIDFRGIEELVVRELKRRGL